MIFLLILGQKLYARVLWSPEQDLKSAYKLTIEKVFLCTGRSYFHVSWLCGADKAI